MAPELLAVEVDDLSVARLRFPLEDPALLPAASAAAKLAVPELASLSPPTYFFFLTNCPLILGLLSANVFLTS